MMRRALLPLLLLLSLPAPRAVYADMFQNASNADQPDALEYLTNHILTLSGGVLQAGSGSETPLYGTSVPTVLDIVKGTDAAPITTAGQQIRILYRHGITKDKCFDNAADTGCNSPILVNAIGDAATTMVTSGATFYARGSGTAAGTDVQAINAIGDVYGSGIGYGMGAYIQGRMFTGTGRAVGAEISAGNYSNANTCAVATTGLGRCVGVWVGARSNNAATPLDSAVQIGTDAAVGGFGSWKQGITLNNNAIFNAPNTGTVSFGDYSASETSLYIRGTHTYAMRTDPNGGGIIGLGTFAPTAKLEMDGNYSQPYSSAGVIFKIKEFAITDTTSSGTVAVVSASRIGAPILRATNATTYTEAATLTIGGCPVADTNVTITRCTGLKVGNDLDVTGGIYRNGGTAGVSCTGAPTAAFRSIGGIVTAC